MSNKTSTINNKNTVSDDEEDNNSTPNKNTISLLKRILIPVSIVLYLIILNNYLENYNTFNNLNINKKIYSNIPESPLWNVSEELKFKLFNPRIFFHKNIEVVKKSLSSNTIEHVNIFLKKTGLYLLFPLFPLIKILFSTLLFPFTSYSENEPSVAFKGLTVFFILFFVFIIPLYPLMSYIYFIVFFIIFYIILPFVNITKIWTAIKNAKYVILFLLYYILNTIITNHIKETHTDLWKNGLDTRVHIFNTLITLVILLVFFIF